MLAILNQPLTQPESGWTRIDDQDPMFTYTGYQLYQHPDYYQGSTSTSLTTNSLTFSFYGTGLRIIGDYRSSNRVAAIKIKIDGIEEVFSQLGGSGWLYQVLNYEKIGLTPGIHHVEIIGVGANSGHAVVFDAIDIQGGVPLNGKRTLIFHDGQYKYYSLGWKVVGPTVSEQDYIDYGMQDVSLILESQWKELVGQITLSHYTDDPATTEITVETETSPYTLYDEFGNFLEVLYYTGDVAKTSAELEVIASYSPLDELSDEFEVVTWVEGSPITPELNLSFLAHPQLVQMKANLPIEFKEVNSVTMAATIEGTSTIKVAVSEDSGLNYKVWSAAQNKWTKIDIHGTEFASSGMSIDEVNRISKSAWMSIFDGKAPKLRFAYYLEKGSITDTVAINTVAFNLLVPGRWKVAKHGTEYDYEYASGEMIYFSILADGNYKINYPINESLGLGGYAPAYDDAGIQSKMTSLELSVMKLAFKSMSATNASKYVMHQMIADDFNDTSGIDLNVTNAFHKEDSYVVGTPAREHDMSGGTYAANIHTSKNGDTTTASGGGKVLAGTNNLYDADIYSLLTLGNAGSIVMHTKFAKPMSLSKIEAIYARTDTGSYDMKMTVEVSKDSTNGKDGTWHSPGNFIFNSSWNSISFSEKDVVYMRLTVTNVAGAWTALSSLKIYGIESQYDTGISVVQSIPEKLEKTPTKLLLSAIEEYTTGSIMYEASVDGGITWTSVVPDTPRSLDGVPEGTELVLKATLTNDAILHAWSYSWN